MWDKALAAGFVIFWSSGFVGATLAAEAGSVTGVLAWRYLITALVLLVLIAPRRPRIGGRDLGQQVCLGLLAHVVFLGGVFGAAGLGLDAGTSTLICAVQPMLVTAVGCWWWGDATSRIRMLGLGLGLLAVGVTVGVPGAGAGTAMLLPVASLLGLSLAALLERAWRPDVDVLLSLTVQVTVAAVVFTAYAAAVDELGAVPVTFERGPRHRLAGGALRDPRLCDLHRMCAAPGRLLHQCAAVSDPARHHPVGVADVR